MAGPPFRCIAGRAATLIVAVPVLALGRFFTVVERLAAFIAIDAVASNVDETLDANTRVARFFDSAGRVRVTIEVITLTRVREAVVVIVNGVVFARAHIATVGDPVSVIVGQIVATITTIVVVTNPIFVVVGTNSAGIPKRDTLRRSTTVGRDLLTEVVGWAIVVCVAGSTARLSVVEVQAEVIVAPAVVVGLTLGARHCGIQLALIVTRRTKTERHRNRKRFIVFSHAAGLRGTPFFYRSQDRDIWKNPYTDCRSKTHI